jgi:pantoate--beta-alanine ligase
VIDLTTIPDLKGWVRARRREGRRIGLVPTMGYLHQGHLALVDEARRRADVVILSIFVNPLQFGPMEDLARYPRDLVRDRRLAEDRGVDALFLPSEAVMYPPGSETRVAPGRTADRWEGVARPGHFGGVLTVVAKLFHLVEPDVACFGRKDVQQAVVVRQMVRDLDWPIELAVVPTVREPDGLALTRR